jgi:biotin carboxyl carrier protein
LRIKVHLNGQAHEVLVEKNEGDYRVTIGETVYKCVPKDGGLLINGEFLATAFDGSLEEGVDLTLGDRKVSARVEPIVEVERVEDYEEAEESEEPGKDDAGTIAAPMPGKLMAIKVKVGDKVQPNTIVAILEAMKMENEILAGVEGTVKEIRAKAGETVEGGKVIVVIE